MQHQLSAEDQGFRQAFEANAVAPAQFNHRGHLRLAYIYLAEHDADAAHDLMRRAILGFIAHHGVPVSKYNETLTRAWILAVRHFMEQTPNAVSSADFIDQNPRLLDSKIMLTHYSPGVLFSDDARAQFVAPDLEPIPAYG